MFVQNVLIEALSLNSIAISTKCKRDTLLLDERALSETMQEVFDGLIRFSYEVL